MVNEAARRVKDVWLKPGKGSVDILIKSRAKLREDWPELAEALDELVGFK